jgi:hypothetical protein
MADKHVILVAGYDYAQSGVNFETFCRNRMHLLIKKIADLKFTLFDIRSGVVKVSEWQQQGTCECFT